MTPDQHMQKAREIVQALIAHSSSTLFAEDIATALHSAQMEERERIESMILDRDTGPSDFDYDNGYRAALHDIATAIRTTKAD